MTGVKILRVLRQENPKTSQLFAPNVWPISAKYLVTAKLHLGWSMIWRADCAKELVKTWLRGLEAGKFRWKKRWKSKREI